MTRAITTTTTAWTRDLCSRMATTLGGQIIKAKCGARDKKEGDKKGDKEEGDKKEGGRGPALSN